MRRTVLDAVRRGEPICPVHARGCIAEHDIAVPVHSENVAVEVGRGDERGGECDELALRRGVLVRLVVRERAGLVAPAGPVERRGARRRVDRRHIPRGERAEARRVDRARGRHASDDRRHVAARLVRVLGIHES